MRKNECTKILRTVAAAALLFTVGCATITYHRLENRSLPKDESYLETLNREMREKHRAPSRWSQKRHIGFFGSLKETEQKFGAKLVFPF